MSISLTSSEVISPQTLVTEEIDVRGSSQPTTPFAATKSFEQKPMSLTLDGPRVFISATALVLLMQLSPTYTAQVVVALIPIILFIQNDFQNYLSLGPGGTPSTFRGYLWISWLRLWTIRDPYTAPTPRPDSIPSRGVLLPHTIPYRIGPKPQTAGIAPHRQIDQRGSEYCFRALRRTLQKLHLKSPNKFGTARSCVEKHGLGLFAKHAVQTNCQGEVCHVHNSDFSMHMCLHPDDSKELLRKGWGVRHPLAWKWWFISTPVSPDFVMVYAPRDEYELRTVCKFIEAAIWYTTSEETEVDVYLKSA